MNPSVKCVKFVVVSVTVDARVWCKTFVIPGSINQLRAWEKLLTVPIEQSLLLTSGIVLHVKIVVFEMNWYTVLVLYPRVYQDPIQMA